MNSLAHKLARVILAMPSKRYLSYIRSTQWERVRNEHLFRCDYRCEMKLAGCQGRAMQVHHWTYARLGHELPQDLCAVCVSCHHRIHCAASEPPANDNQMMLPLKMLPLKKGA